MSQQIYINLKRFDVPRAAGGLCPVDDPAAWIEDVIAQTVSQGLGQDASVELTYLLPEGLIVPAVRALNRTSGTLNIGCQGVHWDDVTPGGNFGAFTTALPAAAARGLGCTWAIIGHSEERRFKLHVLQTYDQTIDTDSKARAIADSAVDRLINAEVNCALDAGLNVLICVGETSEQRGEGSFDQQRVRIEAALKGQLVNGLRGAVERAGERQIVIGYEPIWAIGPGKTPPGEEYISFVSALIKQIVQEQYGFDPVVVYGGGLKKENAAMITGIDTIGGGLVALTRFTGEIGFSVPELAEIIEQAVGHKE